MIKSGHALASMLRHSLESLALIGIALIFAMRFVSEKYDLVTTVIVLITWER